ncbi:MAG: tRNA (adenosine(37)-N6)-threonylcarbamoyltransferase complex dimerization subunit type 1 TsaB [Fibrobacterota bacterium]
MCWTLGLDTSSTTLSIGLYRGQEPVVSLSRYVKNSHAEHISRMMQALLEQGQIGPSDIQRCGVVHGPGSFTGLRIGISFLKGFFLEKGACIYSCNALENTAAALHIPGRSLGVAFDARQGHVFYGAYEQNQQGLSTLREPVRITAQEFYDLSTDCDVLACNTMGFPKSSVFEPLQSDPRLLRVQDIPLQTGLSAARAAAQVRQDSLCDILDVSPDYMQKSYAERGRR